MSDFDYKQFRANAALNILCAMINVGYDRQNATNLAIESADNLIKKLEKADNK